MKILLFDIDGTLTPSGDKIKPEMISSITEISCQYQLGIVGGGNYQKISWQLGDTIHFFKYVFSECGAVIYVDNKLVVQKNMLDFCDRDILNQIVKTALSEISKMPIIYHGHQIDFRYGLVYISPPGMQATSYERDFFIKADSDLQLRKLLIQHLNEINHGGTFEIVLGGAVGIAVYPKGWDKSQVVDFFNAHDEIYYFGDKTEPDGNDYPLFSHPAVHGVAVNNYNDTINYLKKMI
jgi:phosphomannomutase